jgi:eukaryotic-like serine/threonine-protein kinase
MKLFGLLVLKGHLKKEDVLRCLQTREQLTGKGKEATLSQIAVGLKMITSERLALYKLSGGEDVPALPGFELEGKIGEGGMSSVFRYHETAADRAVAVKILKTEQAAIPSVKKAFLKEARSLIEMDHPNVIKGFRVGTVRGQFAFIMEFAEGGSLHDLIRKGMIFDEDAALYIILQAARAMKYMLACNILHRDIKPGNLLIDRKNTLKLIDLGLAATLGEDEDGALDDTTIGTAHYISPEQARGQRDLDIRSDIYSLGATLYQLVLGELPFEGEDDQEVMARQILESLSSTALKGQAISPHMHYFIEKMMVKDREIRYQNPDELIKDIEVKIEGKKTLFFRPDQEGEPDEGSVPKGQYGSKTGKTPKPAGRKAGKKESAAVRKARRRIRQSKKGRKR